MVCRRYSRAYLCHLFRAHEILASILNTHHNLFFFLDLMRAIREAIAFGNLSRFSSEFQARLEAGPHSRVAHSMGPRSFEARERNGSGCPAGRGDLAGFSF